MMWSTIAHYNARSIAKETMLFLACIVIIYFSDFDGLEIQSAGKAWHCCTLPFFALGLCDANRCSYIS